MLKAKDCLAIFIDCKNTSYTTDTALSVAFGVLFHSVESFKLGGLLPDETLFVLIEKMRIEWDKFTARANKMKYGQIAPGSFEKLNKATQARHHSIWLAYKKKRR